MMKISVIVPVYNVENYLEKCLDMTLAFSKVAIIGAGAMGRGCLELKVKRWM